MADFSLYHFIDFGNNYAHKNQTTVQMKNTKKKPEERMLTVTFKRFITIVFNT